MTDAPERIWLSPDHLGQWYAGWTLPTEPHPSITAQRYTRSDLAFPKDVAEELVDAAQKFYLYPRSSNEQALADALTKAEAALKGE